MYRIVSATGEENRTMSQLIFNPNKYYPIREDEIKLKKCVETRAEN